MKSYFTKVRGREEEENLGREGGMAWGEEPKWPNFKLIRRCSDLKKKGYPYRTNVFVWINNIKYRLFFLCSLFPLHASF